MSVVVPVYRSEECVAKLVAVLTEAFQRMSRTYEIILVNDCSPDGSWERIAEAAKGDANVRDVNLRRNFGQDSALMAGLGQATGDIIVIMDDDLQHDPRDMEALVREVERGADVCYARFREKKQTWWKNVGSWLNGKLAEVVIGKPPGVYLSPYKAIARPVVEEVIKYEGPYPYVDGLIFRVTHNIVEVEAEHHERYAGSSTYTFLKSVGVWLKLATSFSLAPLRIATYLGFMLAGFGLFLALYFIVRTLLGSGAPLGWASIIVSVLVLGGVQLACLGIVGEYLGRVFIHLNRRPQYIIRETAGGPDERDSAEAS